MKRTLTISVLLLLLAGCELPTARMSGYAVHGIDVSHYQSRIDWPEVADQDIHFAFIKASEGMSLADSLFLTNWEAAKAAGIKRGAYHFFRPGTPVYEQVANFKMAVKLEIGDLPPVLDVEVFDEEAMPKVKLISEVLTWLYLAEIHYGVKPILYTNLKFYNKYLAGHFDEYPLWVARYSSRFPSLACGRDWQFWQYGNRGELDGIRGPVDFNVFKGSMRELDSMSYQPRQVLSVDGLVSEL